MIANIAPTMSNLRQRYAQKWLYSTRSILTEGNLKSVITQPFTIKPSLTMTDERIVRFPLIYWCKKLLNDLHSIEPASIHDNNQTALQSLAVTFNQSSFVFALIGQDHVAEEICMKMIKYYYAVYESNGSDTILCNIIQPWINIARLARIKKNYATSNNMIRFLGDYARPNNEIEHYVAQALTVANENGYPESYLARYCHMIEQLINQTEAKNYSDLLVLLQQLNMQDAINIPAMFEALIILYNKIGNSIEYGQSVIMAYNNCRMSDLDVFSLRLIEYLFATGQHDLLQEQSDIIYHYALDVVNSTESKPEILFIIWNIAKTLSDITQVNRSVQLLTTLLDRYQIMNDELDTLAVLRLLCTLPHSKQAYHRTLLEQRLSATDYHFQRSGRPASWESVQLVTTLKNDIERFITTA